MSIVTRASRLAVPQSVKAPLELGFIEIFEFAAVVPYLMIIKVLNLPALQGRFKPQIFRRRNFIDSVERVA